LGFAPGQTRHKSIVFGRRQALTQHCQQTLAVVPQKRLGIQPQARKNLRAEIASAVSRLFLETAAMPTEPERRGGGQVTSPGFLRLGHGFLTDAVFATVRVGDAAVHGLGCRAVPPARGPLTTRSFDKCAIMT
jgi:hypothetical protein